MALGVLEDKTLEHVPGTVYVLDDASRTAIQVEQDTHSKRDKTGQIILVPQPSDSPDDPLVRLPVFCNASFVELTEC
jgi:hypothetical protein